MRTNTTLQAGARTQYAIRCDDCKTEIGRTNSLSESAAGGRCEKCKSKGMQPENNKRGYIDKGDQGITFKSFDAAWPKYAFSQIGSVDTKWFKTYDEAKFAFNAAK